VRAHPGSSPRRLTLLHVDGSTAFRPLEQNSRSTKFVGSLAAPRATMNSARSR
jgi:hypothetical protein